MSWENGRSLLAVSLPLSLSSSKIHVWRRLPHGPGAASRAFMRPPTAPASAPCTRQNSGKNCHRQMKYQCHVNGGTCSQFIFLIGAEYLGRNIRRVPLHLHAIMLHFFPPPEPNAPRRPRGGGDFQNCQNGRKSCPGGDLG